MTIFGTNSPNYAGRVGIGTNTPATKLHVNGIITHGGLTGPSDSRLKKNIQPLEYGLKEILKITPVTYNWNGKAGLNDVQTHVGVVAQNIQSLIPEVVSTWTYTDIKDDKTESEKFLAIQTDVVQYILINAVKELHEIIDAQAERIEQLERLLKIETKLRFA